MYAKFSEKTKKTQIASEFVVTNSDSKTINMFLEAVSQKCSVKKVF